MDTPLTIPQKKRYKFLPHDFRVGQWSDIQPYYNRLLTRDLESLDALRCWVLDRNELEGALADYFGWCYISMTRETANRDFQVQYEAYVKHILPKTISLNHLLNEKLIQCPHSKSLREEASFDIWLRCIENSIHIYRSENVPIMTTLQLRAQEYGQIAGAMTVDLAGEECTLQQAAVHLESQDRALRQQVYEKMGERRLQDKHVLDNLYTALVQKRHQIAINSAFDNFRDYAFISMNRFDYTAQDCFDFHNAVEKEVVPLLDQLAEQRKKALGIEQLKPWDTQVDITQKPALRPFKSADDLLQKTIQVFDRLDTSLGDYLRIMEKMGHFDLASRKGKAPGGYNYPLDEVGVPFIFMNATSTLQDMVTMIHEGGHAIHSFMMMDLEVNDFKHPPSEVAELASMSMELLTMDHWDLFFEHKEDLKRAKRLHLTGIIQTLAWVATVDAFQHWVYEHPEHTLAEREAAWLNTLERFSSTVVDWSGQEAYKTTLWQRQLHLFEVPFYYIEYGIAQLGAVAIWEQYQKNPERGLENYLAALRLGYTHSVPDIYKQAGIQFTFDQASIHRLIQFLQAQLALVQ